MIGSTNAKARITELLQEIAHNNKQNYGHILDMTDCGSTIITLGCGKEDYDDNEWYRLSFDVIWGDIIDVDGSCFDHIPYDYFELSSEFEKNMNNMLNSLTKALDNTTEEEKQTIERLEALANA